MVEETIAEVVARMLAERGLTLGTVECGVDGIVSRRIFEAPDGPTVLGNSLIVDDVEEAIDLLDLPQSQFRSAGDFSAKAARAAAREGLAFLGVNLCLAVWARGPVDEEEEQTVHVAFHTGREMTDQTFEVGGKTGRDADWLVNRALDMVRPALL